MTVRLGVYEGGELVAVASKEGITRLRDPAYVELQKQDARPAFEKAEQNAQLIDLFLIQLRAQMRSLVAANVLDMNGLGELVLDEVQYLIQEHYPHADA